MNLLHVLEFTANLARTYRETIRCFYREFVKMYVLVILIDKTANFIDKCTKTGAIFTIISQTRYRSGPGRIPRNPGSRRYKPGSGQWQ